MIDEKFKIDTNQLQLSLSQSPDSKFYLRKKEHCIIIAYPQGTHFDDSRIQMWLQKVVIEQLRAQAKMQLVTRLHFFAQQHQLEFNKVSINSAQTRWGSCSSRKSINLSLYLMLLPQHLSDYVLLHELCHLKEMNHGPKFWELLNLFTDGKAKSLRKELSCYRPQI